MELKRGKLALGSDPRLTFKNMIATLLTRDGLVYILSDETLSRIAEKMDTLKPVEARDLARKVFGSATSARVSKKNVLYVRDSKPALAAVPGRFDLAVLDDGLAVIVPEGASLGDAALFREEIARYGQTPRTE